MKEQIIQILQKLPMPGESFSIVEANCIKDIVVSKESITIQLALLQKYEKYTQAIVPTITDSLTRELQFTGAIDVRTEVLKANQVDEFGGVSQVKHIIAVASGKGGVGKSTVSSNLAVTLAKLGYKVGLLDADIFGPSVPKMFKVEGEKPIMETYGDKNFIAPIEKYGVKMLSIGFFVDPADAVVWRGPMAGNALKQLITEANWGELDVMLIDMPPGTSDIQLTITQVVALSGAVMVSTPQDVAVIDVVKGIDFFVKDAIHVPVLGIIENMAWFTPAELPNNKYYIFGNGGAEALAAQKNIPFLGAIPLVQSIREGGDSGEPIACKEDSVVAIQYAEIAQNIMKQLSE